MTITHRPTGPLVSILLTSWNTQQDTARCLASLHRTASGVDYEVIAVDNGSLDGSAELLAADPRVTLLRNRTNLGFAAAMNQAKRAARGELLLLLNSDIFFHPGTLETMVTFLLEHPDAAGVSPLYLNEDGSFQQHYVQLPGVAACLGIWTVLRRVPGFRGALRRFDLSGQDFSRPRELASGSCMLLRSVAVGPGDLFDEAFPIYWNDAILTARLQADGHRMWMIPDAVVTHARGASCRRLGPAMRFRHLLGGMVCYLRRTQPGYRVEFFRAVLVADHLLKGLFGRTRTLGWTDLRAALRGDVGPLPDGETCDWEIVVRRAAAVLDDPGPADAKVRTVFVDGVGERRGGAFAVRRSGDLVWHTNLPARLPFGRQIATIGRLNQRWAIARLRKWLDGYAGARTLHLDPEHAHLVGRLGEDRVVFSAPNIRESAPSTRVSAPSTRVSSPSTREGARTSPVQPVLSVDEKVEAHG